MVMAIDLPPQSRIIFHEVIMTLRFAQRDREVAARTLLEMTTG
jgi:hypothetical protein